MTYRQALEWLIRNDAGVREPVEDLRTALDAAAAVASTLNRDVAVVEDVRLVREAREAVTSSVIVSFVCAQWPSASTAIASDLVDALRRVEAEGCS